MFSNYVLDKEREASSPHPSLILRLMPLFVASHSIVFYSDLYNITMTDPRDIPMNHPVRSKKTALVYGLHRG